MYEQGRQDKSLSCRNSPERVRSINTNFYVKVKRSLTAVGTMIPIAVPSGIGRTGLREG